MKTTTQVTQVVETDGKKVVTPGKTTVSSGLNISLVTDLSVLRRRLEAAESGLIQHLHVSLKENGVQQCSQRLVLLQVQSLPVATTSDGLIYCPKPILKVHLHNGLFPVCFIRMYIVIWTPSGTSTCV